MACMPWFNELTSVSISSPMLSACKSNIVLFYCLFYRLVVCVCHNDESKNAFHLVVVIVVVN
jgi:hypothetical protein